MSEQRVQGHDPDIRVQVREAYGRAADRVGEQVASGGAASCCGGEAAESGPTEQVIRMYETDEVALLPDDVTHMAMGCGDPVTLAQLRPGQTVLDLGSGGGIDCFLAAKRVGPGGRVIGVDMTAKMIEKARSNQRKVGADNVEFRLGEIEHLPVADDSVDVIISNCVINLSPDKPQVFREAFRVLKPGGKLAVSDIMTDGPLPEAVTESIGAWAGCLGGALEEQAYVAAIKAAGFVDVTVERIYPDKADMEAELEALGLAEQAKDAGTAIIRIGDEVRVIELEDDNRQHAETRTFSGKVRARKPA